MDFLLEADFETDVTPPKTLRFLQRCTIVVPSEIGVLEASEDCLSADVAFKRVLPSQLSARPRWQPSGHVAHDTRAIHAAARNARDLWR